MSGLEIASLHRSISAMSYGLQDDIARKKGETARSKLGESDQQFQIAVSGKANTLVAWTEKKIKFHEVLYYAPQQRDSNRLEEPHCYFGVVLKSGPPVIITGIVKAWTQSKSGGNFIGATIGIGVHAPDATQDIMFAASLHVTVQGFGAPVDLNDGQSEG